MAQSDAIGNDNGYRSVLITRFSALGDVAMTIPVIYSACRCYPSVKFVLATRKSIASLFVNKPDNLVVEGFDIRTQHAGATGQWNLIKSLKSSHDFDAYIDLQNDRSTRFMRLYCLMHRIPVAKFNRALHHKRALTRRTNKVMLPMVSTRSRYRETFFNAGMPVEGAFSGLYAATQHGDPSLFASFVAPREADEKWVGIAPFAAYAEKEYPLDKMEEVLKMLVANPNIRVFIFGGEGRESQVAQSWQQSHPRVTSLAGQKHGFPAELSLLSHLDVMITMDSANMHLASIVGTPTISIWGATHYYCGFKGWKQSEADMVQLPLSCRPCSLSGDRQCYRKDRLCLTAIRPDIIYNKTIETLKKGKQAITNENTDD